MYTYVIPCLLGLEKLVSDEVRRLGLQDVRAENGRVLCRGTLEDCARLNINLRCGARVMLVLAEFYARSFEELFQGTKAVAWEDYLPRDAAFPVKGYSISSQLHAVPACQSIIKK
ncbi:MAG: THUMP domain-containing protein, partial [Oscillospiraceae bacterium]|nr:THUMP domain-containing protein [Oscillospiraceae bacterium]